MTTEIELKFIAKPHVAASLADRLAAWPHQHTSPVALTNIYYETPDTQLRRWNMGLRIRGIGEHYEMTLKTAGQTLGGLHQRPEYNVELSKPELDIARLPAGIWPTDCDLAALQAQLRPLFTTHFQRERWLVSCGQSEIEVALDRGEIATDAFSEPLCEVELELKRGQVADVLTLAEALSDIEGLRLGNQSKAARGYWLAQGKPLQPVRPLPVLRVQAKASIEEGMQAAFGLALSQWQYHEELWLRGDAAAPAAIFEALETVRETFTLFGALVPRKASNLLRQKLSDLIETLAQQQPNAETLCYSPQWLDAQLALTHWLASAGWRPFVEGKNSAKLHTSFKRFADIMLGRIAADLKETFSTVRQHSEYSDKSVRLRRQLLAVHLLAGAYAPETVEGWLHNWQLLLGAIPANRQQELNSLRQQALKQPAFWLNGKA